jgi:hypothetical protein
MEMKSNPVIRVVFWEQYGRKVAQITRKNGFSRDYIRENSYNEAVAYRHIVDIINKSNYQPEIIPMGTHYPLRIVYTIKDSISVLKQGDTIIVEGEKLIITLDHNNEFSLAPVDDVDDPMAPTHEQLMMDTLGHYLDDYEEEIHSEWVRSLNVPTEEEVFEYLDKLQASAITNMFEASLFIIQEFGVHSQSEADNLLIKWMDSYADRHGL